MKVLVLFALVAVAAPRPQSVNVSGPLVELKLVSGSPSVPNTASYSVDAEPQANHQVLLYHSQFAPGAFPYTAYSVPYTYTVPGVSSKLTLPLVARASIPNVYSTITPYSGIYHSADNLTLPYTGLYPPLLSIVISPKLDIKAYD
ncbi:hypothetical protein OTU49_000831 [Cherax quadricarinatus]|uniref:Uncharacterized protein n=1 Tax=Cherax quadricarinatus TaxID=27406 RepID=A0AAW0XKT3_CHEQU|nr:uncharacterized protein LOC128689646 [Cherax quadricarinatus]